MRVNRPFCCLARKSAHDLATIIDAEGRGELQSARRDDRGKDSGAQQKTRQAHPVGSSADDLAAIVDIESRGSQRARCIDRRQNTVVETKSVDSAIGIRKFADQVPRSLMPLTEVIVASGILMLVKLPPCPACNRGSRRGSVPVIADDLATVVDVECLRGNGAREIDPGELPVVKQEGAQIVRDLQIRTGIAVLADDLGAIVDREGNGTGGTRNSKPPEPAAAVAQVANKISGPAFVVAADDLTAIVGARRRRLRDPPPGTSNTR